MPASVNTDRFIFQDSSGRRWTWVKISAVALSVIAAVAMTVFIGSLFVPAFVRNPESLANLKKQLHALQKSSLKTAPTESDVALRKKLGGSPSPTPSLIRQHPSSAAFPVRAAFINDGDVAGLASLAKNGDSLTHVLVNRLEVTGLDSRITEDSDPDNLRLPLAKGVTLMLILGNEENGVRVPEGVEALAQASVRVRARFIADLVQRVKKSGAGGVMIDWDDVDPGLKDELTALVAAIAHGLRESNLETWLSVGLDNGFDCFDLDQLSPVVSHFVARLDDENGGGDTPGPPASEDWFDGWLHVASRYASPEKWIGAISSFGYDWVEGAKKAEAIGFADVLSRADNAGIETISVAAPTFNGSYSYFAGGVAHEVWFTDATSFLNQLGAIRDTGWAGFAVNRLGSEDPGVWNVVDADLQGKPDRSAIPFMEKLDAAWGIPSIGSGEIVSLDPTTTSGKRKFSITDDDRVASVYEDLPARPTLFRAADGGPHKVALTFDDGPDPAWTPQILKILRERGIKATFFMVGGEMEDHPDLVDRVVADGHEIGNHSYTHPNLARVSDARITLELNATQRLLESLTGRSTTLFRPPYNADSRPADPEELRPIRVAQSLGYSTILENIDPRDWQTSDPAEILQRVIDQREQGNIILLHDGGGDRHATVAALPQIIDYLTERGDQIVPVSELLNSDRDTVMPPVRQGHTSIAMLASAIGFRVMHAAESFLNAFLIVATLLVAIRTILVVTLAIRHSRRPPVPDGFTPPVSVLVPAYNEELVIEKTLSSLLRSNYPGEIEILVIDDGSSDATARIVSSHPDPRVRLVTQVNSGKARALQRGIIAAKNEFLVFMDADTQFDPDAIRHLVAPFRDANVGAVSGHARVGNRGKFLTRCQDLEYICGFNLDRRAYAVWNCITVVPGAISAARRAAIVRAGGLSCDTLAEDTDLTLAIHRAGYRIDYQSNAIAYTEAPETYRALGKQRFRWAYGTLQCAWKHRDIVFNPRFKALGWFSLPGIWFFQVILVAFSPFIDLMFLHSIWNGTVWEILPYFLVFVAVDLIMAFVAVHMEKLPPRTALTVIPQRFLYRPLLSFVIWKSIFSALRGAIVGWGKLHRTSTVSIP